MELKGIPCFDIEAVGWINPIAVGFYDGTNYMEFIRENEQDDVIWRFLTYLKENWSGLKLYAHCASRYDNKIILSSLCKHGEIAIPEAGLIRLRWKGPNILFEDSYLLIPMRLADANKLLEVESKQEWEHANGLKPWEMGNQLGTFREYLKTDCVSLSNAIYKMCELLGRNFGVMPSISLSTTSAKVFSKCFYDIENIDSNELFEGYIREAIYGGRNEVYTRYGENINLYDVHFMYVSCYNVPMPIGRMRWAKPNIDTATLVEATVKIPTDLYIGPLPLKTKKRLLFPVGEPSEPTWWDARELKNAASKYGVDFTIRRQLDCDEEIVMKDFGEFIHALSKKNEKQRDLWKMFGLSLSGKLGQGRWRDIVKHIDDIKSLEGMSPLDNDELYFQGKVYLSGRAPYIKPAISMRVRAEARIRHLDFLYQAYQEGPIYYSDTDSIYTGSILPTGEGMGDLTLIGIADRGYFIKQKLYAIIQKRRIKQRSAGYSDLKLSEEDFQKLLEGGEVEKDVEDLSSYRSIYKEGEVSLIERPSVIKGLNSENRILSGIETSPICLP